VGLSVGLILAWLLNDSGMEAAGAIAAFLSCLTSSCLYRGGASPRRRRRPMMDDKEDRKIQKRIAKAEKRAVRYAG